MQTDQTNECPHCGRKIRTEWRICPFCRESLRDLAKAAPVASTAPIAPAPVAAPSPPREPARPFTPEMEHPPVSSRPATVIPGDVEQHEPGPATSADSLSAQACKACGRTNEQGGRFCTYCGAPLERGETEQPLSPPVPPVSPPEPVSHPVPPPVQEVVSEPVQAPVPIHQSISEPISVPEGEAVPLTHDEPALTREVRPLSPAVLPEPAREPAPISQPIPQPILEPAPTPASGGIPAVPVPSPAPVEEPASPAGKATSVLSMKGLSDAGLGPWLPSLVGAVGGVLLIAGTFSPMMQFATAPITTFNSDAGMGVLFIGTGLGALLLAGLKWLRELQVLGAVVLFLIGFVFWRITSTFAGLGSTTAGSGLTLQWGWAVLVIGGVLLLSARLIALRRS